MFFSLKDLELRKVPFQTSYPPGMIDFLDPALRQASPIEVGGVAELAGPQQDIRVRGRLAGSMEASCDRCLDPVPLPVAGVFDLLYRPSGSDDDQDDRAITDEESEIGYYEGSGINLDDVVREQVLLWLPGHVHCSEACQGICPMCGANRNRETCGCQAPKLDERWAALKSFKTGD
jgi:uncharacterized protein